MLAWYRGQAAAALGVKDWSAARWHVGRLAQREEELGRANDAVSTRKRTGWLEQQEVRNWREDAVRRLQDGNADGFRLTCREILARFGDTTDYGIARDVVETCTLAPTSAETTARIVKLAEAVLARHPLRKMAGTASALAAVYFRAGRFTEAIQLLEKEVPDDAISGKNACDWYFLAMAHHQLGHADDARKCYETADEKWSHGWYRPDADRKVLAREAEELLKKPPPKGMGK
jgi:tetratricopeptide (TPR) repeat protein